MFLAKSVQDARQEHDVLLPNSSSLGPVSCRVPKQAVQDNCHWGLHITEGTKYESLFISIVSFMIFYGLFTHASRYPQPICISTQPPKGGAVDTGLFDHKESEGLLLPTCRHQVYVCYRGGSSPFIFFRPQ